MKKQHFRRIFYIACCVILCTVFLVCTDCVSAEESASTEEQFLKLIEQMREEQEENREEVIEAIYDFGSTLLSDWPEDAEEQTEAGEQTDSEGQAEAVERTDSEEADLEDGLETMEWRYDMEQAYQANRLKSLIITESKKNGFESCIRDELLWYVPFETREGGYGLSFFLEDEESGKFRYVGGSTGDPSDSRVTLPPSAEVIAENFGGAVTGETLQKVQYTYSDLYGLTLIYVVTDKEEYIIPYAGSGDWFQKINKRSKLYNGKVYTMSKFMKEMNRLFDEKPLAEGKNGDLVGPSMPYREGIYLEPWMKVVMAGGVVIIICVLVVIKKKGLFRRKKEFIQSGGEEADSPWARPSEEKEDS